MAEYSHPADADLVEKCLQGDAGAWETLVRRYQRLIASITFKFRLESEDSADVFQSVCLALLQQLPNLNKQARLSSWIITVSVRECWRLRHRGKAAHPAVEGDEQLDQLPDVSQVLAEDALLLVERQHIVSQAVESLSEPCRRLIHLLFYESEPAPYAEISRQAGLPVSSIGPNRARCLAKLKTALVRSGFSFQSCISSTTRYHS